MILNKCGNSLNKLSSQKILKNINKYCKTRENSNFLKNGKMVISFKIQNFFSRFRMMKQTSPLEPSRKI